MKKLLDTIGVITAITAVTLLMLFGLDKFLLNSKVDSTDKTTGMVRTMDGWESIKDDNPVVYKGFMPCMYIVETNDRVYETNCRLEDDVVKAMEPYIES